MWMDHDGMGWWMLFGGVFWLLFLLAICWIAVTFARTTNDKPTQPTRESPREVVRRRYAAGEITDEEYDRLMRKLET